MSKRFILIAAAAALALAGAAVPLSAETMLEKTVNVGGALMYPSKNIIQNAVNSKDHTTLVAAVKAAGLVDTLSGPGLFTVFAPTNDAFAKFPAGTVDNLVKPENKATLTKILTYHVVPGRMNAASLMKAVKDGEGQAKNSGPYLQPRIYRGCNCRGPEQYFSIIPLPHWCPRAGGKARAA